MRCVLTLVGNGRQPLTDGIVAAARSALPPVQGESRLGADALDLFFASDEPETAEAMVRLALDGAAVDLAVLPAGGRRKRLLIADMDSTMITVECIDELADFAGVRERVSAITERAMRGEIDFEGALTERVALLRGLAEGELQRCYEARVALTPGARTLVQTMKAGGASAALVSGGFTFFTQRVAAACGFDENRANVLLAAGGRLTGEVARPILGRAAKLEALNEITARLGILPADALAVGDGANDLAMIQASGLGVAYHAKPVTAAAAQARVEHGDLTVLLAYQGIPQSEWVSG
ncbi:MAG: phosphoserine phosphatase SerB [Pseudomonadota bacterium]|nr:phosphoserine phosphatase SerB [Pseudomonadota bacterium]